MAKQRPNLLLIGVDSLRSTHMSCYGYPRLTTPNIDQLAAEGVLFENNLSPHIPTTSGYATMLTGLDCFSTETVALRHRGPMGPKTKTLAEILGEEGYRTTSVGFEGNPAARGFQKYLNFAGWGSWEEGPSPKAENLNRVAIPELEDMAAGEPPWFLFLRHMDPHAPYLPPKPFDQQFYSKDPADDNVPDTMGPVRDFKPFCDFHLSWMPPGIRDIDYVTAAYDGALSYMDCCIQRILTRLDELGCRDNTIVVLNSDHGETLAEHDCYFDHHGLYEPTLNIPLIFRYPGVVPVGRRCGGTALHQDLVPTLMELMDVDPQLAFDGHSLAAVWRGEVASHYSECYITECTWMRKEGWRTPQWKLIRALEPDFHFKPAIELYNLVTDPLELHNVAEQEPDVVAALLARMEAWVAKREAECGITNPMYTTPYWSGYKEGPFESSQEAYDTQHIGDSAQAKRIQESKKA